MFRTLYILLAFFIFNTAYSQVFDNFSDGDFTANPTWTLSSASDFSVGASQLKSANTTSNTSFYICTTNTLTSNCTWEFYVNLQLNTSSLNYIDAYLMSDVPNLLATSINGYFVRIGSTADDISLYKRTGASTTSLVIGAAGVLNTSNNTVKIRVTRNLSNLWTLERDITGTGSTYVTEGTATVTFKILP